MYKPYTQHTLFSIFSEKACHIMLICWNRDTTLINKFYPFLFLLLFRISDLAVSRTWSQFLCPRNIMAEGHIEFYLSVCVCGRVCLGVPE